MRAATKMSPLYSDFSGLNNMKNSISQFGPTYLETSQYNLFHQIDDNNVTKITCGRKT